MSSPALITGYSYRNGELHSWYQAPGRPKRWLDTDQLVDGEILKGNADLVGQGVWQADFEARR